MPATVELPSREREVTAPLTEMANLESTRRLTRVTDEVSIKAILKSNTKIAKLLNRCFVGAGKLAKKVFGSVGRISAVFKGLSKIAGGI